MLGASPSIGAREHRIPGVREERNFVSGSTLRLPRALTVSARTGVIPGPSCDGQVAQLVEQRTENPRVGGSIPPLATMKSKT